MIALEQIEKRYYKTDTGSDASDNVELETSNGYGLGLRKGSNTDEKRLALNKISLTIREGEIYGIIGRAQSGKSTLLRCINLLEKPCKGSVVVDEQPLMKAKASVLRKVRQSVGVVFQEYHLLSHQTVFDNVSLPLQLQGQTKVESEEAVRRVLGLLGLTEKENHLIETLNHGQKQRVAIARALVNNPKILLCDEITDSLDARSSYAIMNVLRELNERFNMTIVLATQDMQVIKSLCHRVSFLHQGTIVEEGFVSEVLANPKASFTKECVKAATRVELPMTLKARLRAQPFNNAHAVFRFSFVGSTSQENFIARIIQQCDLTMNIIQVQLETVGDKTMGVMVVELFGDDENVQKAKTLFEAQEFYVEVLGYVL